MNVHSAHRIQSYRNICIIQPVLMWKNTVGPQELGHPTSKKRLWLDTHAHISLYFSDTRVNSNFGELFDDDTVL